MLFVVFTSFAAVYAMRVSRQRRLVDAVEKAGGAVIYDFERDPDASVRFRVMDSHVGRRLREIVGVDFFHTVRSIYFEFEVDSQSSVYLHMALSHIANCPDVHELELMVANLRDSDLELLRGADGLYTVKVFAATITDVGVSNLCELDNLTNLRLVRPRHITASGLLQLGMLPKLHLLGLDGATLPREDRERLSREFPRRTTIQLDGNSL